MEQIALFVLPGSSDEAEDNDEGPDSGGCDDRDQSEPSTIDHPGIARRYDNDGTTFLHKAAHNGDVELARSLLEKGADPIAQKHDIKVDVNALGHVHHSLFLVHALVIPAESNHENILRLLLIREDIEVNKSNPEDRTTLLMWACTKGRNDIIKMLLDKDNVEINKKDPSHTAKVIALMFAC
ncbi:ankyrin repeat-containing domain protein [Pyronema domesticum]|nr:ankyrin repeat-containing domain protein [Pyronema domesticum]